MAQGSASVHFSANAEPCKPSALLLFQARTKARLRSLSLGVIREHDLMTRLAQPRTIVAQTGDDPADIRNVAAAKPKHVRTASVSLPGRAFGESGSTAERECCCHDGNQPSRTPTHLFSPSTMKMRAPSARGSRFSNISPVMGAIWHPLFFKANSSLASIIIREQGLSTLPAGLQNVDALASAAA